MTIIIIVIRGCVEKHHHLKDEVCNFSTSILQVKLQVLKGSKRALMMMLQSDFIVFLIICRLLEVRSAGEL